MANYVRKYVNVIKFIGIERQLEVVKAADTENVGLDVVFFPMMSYNSHSWIK